MAALDFPDSSQSTFVAPNGVTYNWNNEGFWEAETDPTAGYVLPVATDAVLGGVKVGSRLTIAGDGTLSADLQGGGDVSVGNLQEVTDEGNTTTNNIIVGAGGYGTADDGTTILPGYLRLTGTAGTPLNIYKTGDTTAVTKLGVDGSAEFAGKVISGGDPSSGNTGAVLKNAGTVSAVRLTGTSAVW